MNILGTHRLSSGHVVTVSWQTSFAGKESGGNFVTITLTSESGSTSNATNAVDATWLTSLGASGADLSVISGIVARVDRLGPTDWSGVQYRLPRP